MFSFEHLGVHLWRRRQKGGVFSENSAVFNKFLFKIIKLNGFESLGVSSGGWWSQRP